MMSMDVTQIEAVDIRKKPAPKIEPGDNFKPAPKIEPGDNFKPGTIKQPK